MFMRTTLLIAFLFSSAHAAQIDRRLYAPDESGAFVRVSVIKDTVYFENCLTNTPQCDPIGEHAGYPVEIFENLSVQLDGRRAILTDRLFDDEETDAVETGVCTYVITCAVFARTRDWVLSTAVAQSVTDLLSKKVFNFLGDNRLRTMRQIQHIDQAKQALDVVNEESHQFATMSEYQDFIEGLRRMTVQMEQKRCQKVLH